MRWSWLGHWESVKPRCGDEPNRPATRASTLSHSTMMTPVIPAWKVQQYSYRPGAVKVRLNVPVDVMPAQFQAKL